MLKNFMSEWNNSLNERIITNRFETEQEIRQQCVFTFKETDITTSEVWTKEGVLKNITVFVPNTSKFIDPECIVAEDNENWYTVEQIMKGLTIGKDYDQKQRERRKLWLEKHVDNILETAKDDLSKCYTADETSILLDIIKAHIKTDNIERASVITQVLVAFSKELRTNNTTFNETHDSYIDKLYGMFVSIVNRRYIQNDIFTIGPKDVEYLFRRKILSRRIPPIFTYIRELTTSIYEMCDNNSYFIYFADAMCAFYAVTTCMPYNVKLAEIQLREQNIRARKRRNISLATDGHRLGQIGDLPGASELNKLKLK
jgi:hypothetical protein